MDNKECTSVIITMMLFIGLGGLHVTSLDILKYALISAITGTIITNIASWLHLKLNRR